MTPPGKHETEPACPVGVHAVKRPAGFKAAVVEIGRKVTVVRRFRVEGMLDHEIHATHLHLVSQPFHLRVGENLVVSSEYLAHGDVVFLVVNM